MKTYYKSRPVKPNANFNSKFEKAAIEFLMGFLSSDDFNHSLTKGMERETPVRKFLEQGLPEIFEVKSGEVVDCWGNVSPQLDVIVYDNSKTIKFYDGDAIIIPAEALLVSMEVKSKLNRAEIVKVLKSAEKLKKLRPYKSKPNQIKTRESENVPLPCRYFHCVFAYSSDIASENWAKSEYTRFIEVAHELKIDPKIVDRIYVYKKGIINTVEQAGVNEETDSVRSLMYLYTHILNFLLRENKRRDPIPYELYAGRLSQGWKKLI